MYKVIKDFKGSPDGMRVIAFAKGDDFTHEGDLLKVALAEKWVGKAAKTQTAEEKAAEAASADKAKKVKDLNDEKTNLDIEFNAASDAEKLGIQAKIDTVNEKLKELEAE